MQHIWHLVGLDACLVEPFEAHGSCVQGPRDSRVLMYFLLVLYVLVLCATSFGIIYSHIIVAACISISAAKPRQNSERAESVCSIRQSHLYAGDGYGRRS